MKHPELMPEWVKKKRGGGEKKGGNPVVSSVDSKPKYNFPRPSEQLKKSQWLSKTMKKRRKCPM